MTWVVGVLAFLVIVVILSAGRGHAGEGDRFAAAGDDHQGHL